MIADVLALLSIGLFLIRFAKAESVGNRWVIADILSGVTMIFAWYFYTFSSNVYTTQTGTIGTNTLAGSGTNTIQLYNLITNQTTPAIGVTSNGFIMFDAFVFMWVTVNFIFMFKDFLDANKYKQGQGMEIHP